MTVHLPKKKPALWKRLWFQVFIAIFIGIVLGAFFPKAGAAMKPFGDAFIALVKMMIAPAPDASHLDVDRCCPGQDG